METSILTSTKKNLGLAEDYTVFDQDIITYINSAFSTLTSLGVGPASGFMIQDASTEWVEFIGNDPQLNQVQTYIYLRSRMLFDPPATSFHIRAMEDQLHEIEWRLNIHREETEWTDPEPVVLLEPQAIDGGSV